ncbi:MAG: hypothetical protein Tsb0018_07530 [Opitutales bacterium]|tara:strand:- start:2824 stop:3717 length:894 start_codon:yes stop_codon:yes gene_type:complete
MKRKVLGFLLVFAGCAGAFAGEHVDALVAQVPNLSLLVVGSIKEDPDDSLMLKNTQHCIGVLEQVANDGGNFNGDSWRNWAKSFAQVVAYANTVDNSGVAGEAWAAANQLQQRLNTMDLGAVNAELVAEYMLPLVTVMAEYAAAPGDIDDVLAALDVFQTWLTGLLPEEEDEEDEEVKQEEEEEVIKEEDDFGDSFEGDLGDRLANLPTTLNEEEEEVDWGAWDDDDGDLVDEEAGPAVMGVETTHNNTRSDVVVPQGTPQGASVIIHGQVPGGSNQDRMPPICTLYFDSSVPHDTL